jgi:DNA topoisomerase IB
MVNTWKRKDGTLIDVKEMETSHIENCLAMLKKRNYVSKATFEFYLTCSGPDGEMAQWAFEQEQEEILSKYPSKWIDIFEEELKRRGGKHDSG